MSKASVRRWLEAVDRATEWELIPRREVDPAPAWMGIGIGATIFVLGLIALSCQLLGVGQ